MEINYAQTEQNRYLEGPKYPYQRLAIGTLLAFYFFGMLGMSWPWLESLFVAFTPFDSFASLTPFNLVLTCILLFSFHRDWNWTFVGFMVACFFTGFFVEVAGVHTGMVFGEYAYGATLGWKWLDVPWTIGLNWLLLVYSTGVVLASLQLPNWAKALLLGGIMTALDLLIEPVAIRLDFWSWAGGDIPLQNYVSWWVISSVLGGFFFSLGFEKKNPLAKWVLACQAVFFAGQNLLS